MGLLFSCLFVGEERIQFVSALVGWCVNSSVVFSRVFSFKESKIIPSPKLISVTKKKQEIKVWRDLLEEKTRSYFTRLSS